MSQLKFQCFQCLSTCRSLLDQQISKLITLPNISQPALNKLIHFPMFQYCQGSSNYQIQNCSFLNFRTVSKSCFKILSHKFINERLIKSLAHYNNSILKNIIWVIITSKIVLNLSQINWLHSKKHFDTCWFSTKSCENTFFQASNSLRFDGNFMKHHCSSKHQITNEHFWYFFEIWDGNS